MAEQTTAEIPEIAQTVRAQIIEGLQQSQKFAFDAAQTIAKTTSTLPTPKVPALPGMMSAEAATKFTFDFATDLLKMQQDFAIDMAKLFTREA